jgi:hypothetical protein
MTEIRNSKLLVFDFILDLDIRIWNLPALLNTHFELSGIGSDYELNRH